MKKILIYTECFYDGGIEKIIYQIYKNLKSKYKFDILSINTNNTLYSELVVQYLVSKRYKSSFFRNFLGIFKFVKYIKENNYDIVHLHIYNSIGNIYAYYALKYCNRVILHAHNSGLERDIFKIKYIINNLLKRIYDKRICYIAVSEQAKRFCFSKRVYCKVINNGIDYSKFAFNDDIRLDYRKRFNINENDLVIGNIGRLVKQKNQIFVKQKKSNIIIENF